MPLLNRRILMSRALAAALLPIASWPAVAAEEFPVRPIKWIVPFLAGTSPDTTARIVAEAVSPLLGQPVVIENKAGAAGNIGARIVAKAPADGYTWIYSSAPMAANMHMYKEPGYDALKDFRHIMGLTSSDVVVIVNADSDIRSLDDLLAKARARTDELFYASGGVGTPSHLGVELMLSKAGVRATHVPYKGASELVNAVLGQQVTFGAPIFSVAYPQIQAGKLRALAIAGPRRNPMLPQVPTLVELGMEGLTLVSWGGLSVPANTPDAVVARIHAALAKVMKEPAVIAALQKAGNQVDVQESTKYTRGFTQEMALTETMMKRAGLQAM